MRDKLAKRKLGQLVISEARGIKYGAPALVAQNGY